MSKAAKKLEWLVVIYDNAVNQRLKFRSEHLSKLPQLIAEGKVTSGGPVFTDETKSEFLGSSFTIAADSRSEVIDFLKRDIYAKKDVWSFDNVVIHPYSPVFREGIALPANK